MKVITNNISRINNIHFTSNNIEESSSKERAPFYPETIDTIDSVYRDYKKSLCETSLSDVKSTALKLAQETQTPKKEVLKAMQLVTQFSNMKSLKKISESLNKENLCELGPKLETPTRKDSLFCSDIGIQRSLKYVFNRKGLARIDFKLKGKDGMILDENKITQLEELKRTDADKFNELSKSKDMKYFYISGWDTGIPVVDRTKSLEDTTRELLLKSKEEKKSLEEVLDEPLLDRIKALGLKPTIIRNENPATELSVYNQMKPEQMSKGHLINLIEANTLFRTSKKYSVSPEDKASCNDNAVKYIEDTLCVYTPEKMSADLKKMHERITNYAESQGKDVLYILPLGIDKSYDYVNYSYQKVNNIDSSKFIPKSDICRYNQLYPDKPKVSPETTMLVVLDDCSISGDSIETLFFDIRRDNKIPKEYSFLFATLKGTDKAIKKIDVLTKNMPADLIVLDKINLKDLNYSVDTKTIVGCPTFTMEASTLAFPYMAPDNNSEFASNIALLHNSKYLSRNFSNEASRDYTSLSFYAPYAKTMNHDVKSASVEYTKMIGESPVVIEGQNNVTEKKKKSLVDAIKDFFKK